VLASHSQNGNSDTGCPYYIRMRWAAVLAAVLAVPPPLTGHLRERRREVGRRAAVEQSYDSAQPNPARPNPAYQVTAKTNPRDLEGVWMFATLTPLERPAEFAGKVTVDESEAAAWARDQLERGNRDRRDGGAAVDVGRAVNDYWFERGTELARLNGRRITSLVVDPADGRVPPPTEAARAKAAARAADNREHPADGPENRSLQERCLAFNAGPPIQVGPYNNFVKLLQFADHIVVFTEMIHDARIVPLDGRPHVPDAVRLWLGDSRGRWEGDTLVVDTTNFNGKVGFRGTDDTLHLVERFRRVDAHTLLYEFTVDNPSTFTKPWTARMPMTKTDQRIFEYACHEGNYALPDILRGARYQERQRN